MRKLMSSRNRHRLVKRSDLPGLLAILAATAVLSSIALGAGRTEARLQGPEEASFFGEAASGTARADYADDARDDESASETAGVKAIGRRPASASPFSRVTKALDDNIPGVPITASPVNGTLDEASDLDDVYRVTLTAGQLFTVTLNGPAGSDFDMYLYPPGSTDVATDSFVDAAVHDSYPDTFRYTVTVSGTYYLDIYAYSGSGSYSITYSITTYQPPPPPPDTGNTTHALLIGVEDYPGYSDDLQYTVDDVVDVREALMTNAGFAANDIYMLQDNDATHANIQSAITGWLDSVEEAGDTVVVYYSGHGTNEPDASPFDETDGLDESLFVFDELVRDDELDAWLGSLESTKILIGLDTCFSGGFLKSAGGQAQPTGHRFAERPGSGKSSGRDSFSRDLNRTGIITMAASDDYELSSEDPWLQNGIFTYYLVEALKSWAADYNTSGKVSAEEAFQYLNPLVVAYNPEQHPQIYDGVAGQLELAVPDAGSDMADPVTTDNAPAGWQQSDFTVTLSCSDTGGSGCQEIRYRVDGGSENVIPGDTVDIGISTEGDHAIAYHSRDIAGNAETEKTVHARLDKTAPQAANILPAGAVTGHSINVLADLSDSASGVDPATVAIRIDGAAPLTGCSVFPTHANCPASGLAAGSHAIEVSFADNAGHPGSGNGSFSLTFPAVASHYYWPWYDSLNMQNWVLMASPDGGSQLGFDLMIENQYQGLGDDYNLGPGEVSAGHALTFIDPGTIGGHVEVVSKSGDKAVVSQRSVMGNSIEEVPGTDLDRLAMDYHWTWYDHKSAGMTNWIMIANPWNETVHYTVYIAGAPQPVTPQNPGVIEPYQRVTPTFPGVRDGSVRVTGDDTLVASQRVLSGGGSAFNEVPGIPAGELAADYLWTWYDQQTAGYLDWVMIANPFDVEVHYQIKIAGEVQPVTAGNPGVIPPLGKVTPSFPGKMGGPVELTTDHDVIASQRVIAGPSFEEVPGYRRSELARDYHWSWYDQQSPGALNWVMIANPGDSAVSYEVRIAGEVQPVNSQNPGTIPAHGRVTPTFNGKMNGPVEVIASGDVMVSQRVLWKGYFNEVVGTVLE